VDWRTRGTGAGESGRIFFARLRRAILESLRLPGSCSLILAGRDSIGESVGLGEEFDRVRGAVGDDLARLFDAPHALENVHAGERTLGGDEFLLRLAQILGQFFQRLALIRGLRIKFIDDDKGINPDDSLDSNIYQGR